MQTLSCLVGLLVLAGLASATGATAMPAGDPAVTGGSPSITSDKVDYAPGERVTLAGAYWQPGESVHITVNDDAGRSWSRDADVTADADGTIADTFNLPNWFVAEYSVGASGASGSTAFTSFTDGNVKVAVVGGTAAIKETLHTGANCSGAVKSGFPETVIIPPTDTVGVGSSDSLRLDAPATANGGQLFLHWSRPAGGGLVFQPVAGTSGLSVCVAGFQSGSEDIIATYAANNAPTLNAANASVSVNEGTTATNSGSYADANAGDDVTISASRGTVNKTGTSSGTWSWSLATTDGPDQTGPVTITASDGTPGGTVATTFTLNVSNVAPTVTLAAANPLSVDEGSAQRTYSYTISDPGADTVSAVTTSCGANATKVGASDTNTNTAGSFKCTFSDGPNTSIVSASATDSDNATGNLATQSVAVTNVAPAVVLSGADAADEGQTKTYTYTVSDPGSDPSPTMVESCGADGERTDTPEAHSFDCTFADGPASSTVKVTADDGDPAHNTGSDELAVTVTNVAPSVTAPADQGADEGTPANVSLGSFSDPGSDAWSVDVDWGDESDHTTFEAHTGTLPAKAHTYDDDGAYTVTVRVSDEERGSDSKTFRVTVVNLAPTAILGNDGPIVEGSTATIGFTDQVDVSGADTSAGFRHVFRCDGSEFEAAPGYGDAGTGDSKACEFADDGTYTVRARIVDKDGDFNEYTTTVTVANAAPVLTAPADQAADEGQDKSFALGAFADAGAHDSPWDVDVDWGDDTAHTSFGTSSRGPLDAKHHAYADNGVYTVTVKVTDNDGASDTETHEVTVANVAPTVTLAAGNDLAVAEGTTHTYDYEISDPGADTISSVDTSCGTKGTKVDGSDTNTDTSGSFKCTFPDGPAGSTVTASATDSDNGTGATDSQIVEIANAAPSVTPPADQSADEGAAKNIDVGSFTDPGPDSPWAVDVDWGDASTHTTFDATSTGSLGSRSHTYADGPATRTVTVKVTDENGASDIRTFTVAVANIAPTADLGNDGPKGEGSPVTVSFTDPADPSSGDVAAGFRYAFACTAASALPTAYAAAGTAASESCTFPDNGIYVVKGRIFDRDNAYRSYDTSVTVTNVAPRITSFTGTNSLSGPLAFGGSTFTTNFTDPGTADTHRADFSWSSGAPLTHTVDPFVAGDKVNHTFAAGCGRSANVKITDDDGGFDTKSTSVDVGTGTWLPPLADQPISDKLRNGQVLPVKVRIAGCDGVPVTGLTPQIQLVRGDHTAISDDTSEVITIGSVSAVDSGTTMRSADGFYMYNLRINVAAADLNKDFTLIIHPYGTSSPQTLRHVIVPIK